MLEDISSYCFFYSYAATLLLEVSRLFFRAPVRMAVIITFAAAGLFAHSVYWWIHVRAELATGVPLSSWYDWCLIVAWGLIVVYLARVISQPRTALGLFLLPLVLALIGVAELVSKVPGFSQDQAQSVWRSIHGLALLLGTLIVFLGFVAGMMYLVQSYRLKHKLPPRAGLRLPSLELLQKQGEWALVASSVLLAVGLASGVVLNLIKSGVVSWTDPVVWTSGVLFLWLATAVTFNLIYKPARRGRKVAYLVVASFAFLVFELGIAIFYAQHPTTLPGGRSAATQQGGER